MKSMMKKLPPVIIILFLIAQSFLFSYTYAVTPWSGNTWEGNTWQGNTWDGHTWDGHTWDGHTWEGNTFEGETFQGDAFSGNGTQGTPNSIEGIQFQGAPWSIQPWVGIILAPPGSFNGNPVIVPGMTPGGPMDGIAGISPGGPINGAPSITPGAPIEGGPGQSPIGPFNPNTGQYGPLNPLAPGVPNGSMAGGYGQSPGAPYINQNGYGAGYQGPILEEMGLAGYPITSTADSEESSFDPYAGIKFAVHDMGRAQINLIDNANKLGDSFTFSDTLDLRKTALVGGLKLGIQNKQVTDLIDTADTGYSMYTDGKKAYNAISAGRTAAGTIQGGTQTILQGAGAASSTTLSVSRLGGVAAGVGVVFGTYETVTKSIDFFKMDSSTPTNERVAQGADAVASLGETLLNGGMVAAALPIPGAQAAAPFLVLGGAAIWGVAKTTKLVAENWDSIKKFGKSVGDGVKKAYSSVKDSVGDGLSTVAGWFGK
ncbi:hypothetical protein [Jeotgalibacillus sp. JSM ZJ347]|uniref:hypothetical protein n=1 Tax=Jeotgalibacillus sp. JSM ZJ347 TaxID=3342117 RepID=UPI0035A8BA23